MFLKSNFKTHIASVHEGKKPFKCHVCDAKFSNKPNMKRHVAYVHENNKSYKCDMCFKIYKANADLKRHISTIQEEKTIKCESCEAKNNEGTH